MIAIDTNVLVRVLIEDASAKFQCEQARNLVNTEGDLWHTLIHKSVIPAWIAGIQAAWIARSLPSMALNTRFPAGMTTFAYKGMDLWVSKIVFLETVLTVFSASHADFADCLILNEAQHKRLALHTFDRKLARLHGAELIGGKSKGGL